MILETETAFLQWLSSEFKLRDVTPDSGVTSDLGLSSFDLFVLIARLELETGTTFHVSLLETLETVSDYYCFAEARLHHS